MSKLFEKLQEKARNARSAADDRPLPVEYNNPPSFSAAPTAIS